MAFKSYPKRTALGLALFVGQAFIYNAVTFGLGTFLVEFYGISDAKVPFYIVLFAVEQLHGAAVARAAVRHRRAASR